MVVLRVSGGQGLLLCSSHHTGEVPIRWGTVPLHCWPSPPTQELFHANSYESFPNTDKEEHNQWVWLTIRIDTHLQ